VCLVNVRGFVLRFLRARRAVVVVLGLAMDPLWLVEETEIGRKRQGIDWRERLCHRRPVGSLS